MNFAICSNLNSRRVKLENELCKENGDLVRTKIFSDIWVKFHNKEFLDKIDGEVSFVECYNNVIELGIIRSNQEFHIEINNEAMYLLTDEETDNPVEIGIFLSEIKDLENFFVILNEFLAG